MTTDEALELLRGLAAAPPAAGPMTSRDEVAAALSRVADLREAAGAVVVALRREEDHAIRAARELLRDYGDADFIRTAVRRPRQHISTVMAAHRADAPERAAG